MAHWESELVAELEAARNKRGAATQVIEKFRKRTGRSPQSLYRIASRNGYRTQRKKRADMGECVLNEDQISYIAAMISNTAREVKGAIMPVERAIQIATDNNIIEPDCISPSRMSEILRERNLNKTGMDAADPHIRMRSLHPNHVHIVDATICIQYYLKGRLRMEREDSFYKNKPENFRKHKMRIIRYTLTDHYSGCAFWKYYEAAGETADNLYEFLISAWVGEKHPKLPFRGVPLFLLMDAGAANLSGSVLQFLERMNVEIPKSMPHNPRRQGQAECTHNLVERWFESGLRISPATTIEQLNSWALDFCAWFNGKRVHTRHGMTRTACWLRISREQLRELPDIDVVRELYSQPVDDRTVQGDYRIEFKGKWFDVKHIPGLVPNLSKVDVELKPFDWPEAVTVWFKEVSYRAPVILRDAAGFDANAAVIGQEYKAQPQSTLQEKKKDLEAIAFSGPAPKKKADAVPFSGAQVYGNHAAKVAVEFLPKKGVPLQTERTAADLQTREISMMELFKRLKAEEVQVDTALNKALRARFGSSIPLLDVEALIMAARDGNVWGALVGAYHDKVGGGME